MRKNVKQKNYTWRLYFIFLLLLAALAGLFWRIIGLGVVERDFLLRESASRSVRSIDIPAYRGRILDRNGEVLATSVPVDSVWVNPETLKSVSPAQWQALAVTLNIPFDVLQKKVFIASNNKREFVYLQRHVSGIVSAKIKGLNIPGVFLQQEYKRYYPDAEVCSQIVGFTNIDDEGQEGLELAYNDWLRGTPGKKRILKDRLGNVVSDLSMLKKPQPGHDLVLSIDRRIQYLAYQELKNTVALHRAEHGIVVVLSVKTGEVLAMVSVPTCNPNKRQHVSHECYKNRAVTDLFEPGSTAKAFSVANALESGKYKPTSLVDTNPGYLKVEDYVIYDNNHVNNGLLTVTGVLQKSSDIGVAKMALSLAPDSLLNMLKRVGFGQLLQSGFPGEVAGYLPPFLKGRQLVLATIAYGYGISSTALQLAHAYTVIASGGMSRAVSFLKIDPHALPIESRVISRSVAEQILSMLQSVVEFGGTGQRAKIQGYNIAGKTGTSRLAKAHGYYADRHAALFAGIAPASRPELVAVVIIQDPRGGLYHGGTVAAPSFANVVHGALRVLDVPPDAEQEIGEDVSKKSVPRAPNQKSKRAK
jgi:cell division protein FtsI (penicillin-binding protein 3)